MGEFSVTRRGGPLREALARITALAGREDAPTAAIQMLPLAEAMPDFVAQNPMPLLSADIGPKLWLGGAVRTQTHNDRDHNLACVIAGRRSEEHTSELQSLMRISYAVFCLKKKKKQ